MFTIIGVATLVDIISIVDSVNMILQLLHTEIANSAIILNPVICLPTRPPSQIVNCLPTWPPAGCPYAHQCPPSQDWPHRYT